MWENGVPGGHCHAVYKMPVHVSCAVKVQGREEIEAMVCIPQFFIRSGWWTLCPFPVHFSPVLCPTLYWSRAELLTVVHICVPSRAWAFLEKKEVHGWIWIIGWIEWMFIHSWMHGWMNERLYTATFFITSQLFNTNTMVVVERVFISWKQCCRMAEQGTSRWGGDSRHIKESKDPMEEIVWLSYLN